MSCTLTYNETPAHLVDEINKYLKINLHLLPHWVRDLSISVGEKNGTECISCYATYCYRRLFFRFTWEWFSYSDSEKLDTIAHELTHSHNLYLSEYFHEMLDKLCYDDKLKEFIKDEFANRLEICNEDLKEVLKGIICVP